MPLRSLEPPEAVRRAAAAHVHQLATPQGIFPALRHVARENLELVAPHRIYTLSLGAVVEGGFEEARPSGWRFLIADNKRVVASAEVAGDGGEAPSVNGGPYVSSTATAIDELERLPMIAGGAFELRILKVPALYIVAAWLVDETRIVVPLAPTPSYLEAGHPYSEEEFLAALEQPAQQISAQDDGSSGG
jgi:hypothetical protein